jgi:isopentenyl diphosphate isomerase/L-lactate dehydrogenase-like FMN-dependent dehydrogenase
MRLSLCVRLCVRRCGGWGSAQGEAGVARVLELLNDEVALAMTLLGCASVDRITPAHVRRTPDSRL